MKQFKLAAAIFIITTLLSPMSFARVSLKGEVTPAPMTNWTGFYAGLNVGAVNHTMYVSDNQANTFRATLQQVSNPKFTGGFQVGYRMQMDMARASGVYGVELSADFANARFNKQYGSPFTLYQLNVQDELKNIVLLQLTGGIAVDRTLLFLAAGISWANISGTTSNIDTIPYFNEYNVSKKELGTALGVGMEYAFTPNISARFKVDVITPNTYSTYDRSGNSYLIANSIVEGTIGVNYNFNFA